MPSDPYRLLAHYYDHLSEFRISFQPARKLILDPLLPQVNSACDLGCGTGALSLVLAKRGILTFAVDLSPTMCRIMREKAKQTAFPIRVLCRDMCHFDLPQQVDLITCECDALNHVPHKRDLPRVLRCVAKALHPGGHFIFDVNNRLAFARLWSQTWFLDKDPVALVMRAQHQRGSDKATMDLDGFVRTSKLWKRYQEHIEEVCWSAAEIRRGLADAGFDQVRSWDAAPLLQDDLTRPGNRTFWCARKVLLSAK